tara:strand:+ start:2566 stop:2835 length:270 start_codon:yes stop_codon:yes gene_type:complete
VPEPGVCSAHRNTPQGFYIMNAKQFSLKIEQIKRESGDMSYMDAILFYCDQQKIDPAEVGKYVSKSLKEKITIEAQGLNLVEKGGTLPL